MRARGGKFDDEFLDAGDVAADHFQISFETGQFLLPCGLIGAGTVLGVLDLLLQMRDGGLEVFAVADHDLRAGLCERRIDHAGGGGLGGGDGFPQPCQQIRLTRAHGTESDVQSHPGDADDGAHSDDGRDADDAPEHRRTHDTHREHRRVEQPLTLACDLMGLDRTVGHRGDHLPVDLLPHDIESNRGATISL